MAITDARGTLCDDDVNDVLLKYIREIQMERHFAMTASVETELGSNAFLGGGFHILYVMMRRQWQELRRRVGFWTVLLGPILTRHNVVSTIRRGD